ncbi:hypothetical protein ACTRHD_001752 [Enterococcus faecalis]
MWGSLRAYHTYEFLKRRKNDPKWRKAYTSARNKRIIGTLVTINIIIWGFVLWKKIESGDIEVNNIIDVLKSKINEFLN